LPDNAADSNDALFREVPLLARLAESDLQALASRGRVKRYAQGTAIFHEGDAGDAMYVVVEGRVRISLLSGSGGETTLALMGPGDCFGELALFDGKPRSATAAAALATRAFMVSRDDFVAWVKERPSAALALLETLSLRLRRTDEAVTDLVFLDLEHRLAKQLLRLSVSHADGKNAARPRIQVTQGELASILGVSRESVNKQLNAFMKEGWISLSRGAVTIESAAGLRGLT